MVQKHKINIFEVLGHANTKDVEYYTSLPEQERKHVVPLLLQRWMTGTTDARQVFLINEVVNPFVFSLYKHGTLLWQLLTLAAPGTFRKYSWPARKTDGGHTKPTAARIVGEYYKYNTKHANDAVKLLSCEQVIELAHSLGHQSDIVSKIKKEFNVDGAKSKHQ